MDGNRLLLDARGLTKSYARPTWIGASKAPIDALRGVDLELHAGQTLAIVGASGAGKSTLARCLAGLERSTSGEIRWLGKPLDPDTAHRHIQLIFQDPGASLNPRFTVLEALEEPARIRGSRLDDVAERLEQAGLPANLLDRPTAQLSSGQKARLAIARALVAIRKPGILILDETLMSLDLSIRAQIVNLLIDLQERLDIALVFIGHDFALAAHVADEVAVMFEGRIVERGTPEVLMRSTGHPHTRELLGAIGIENIGIEH